jgi:hypothetical protein
LREPAWKLVLFVRTTRRWFFLFFKHCFMSRTYCCATGIVSWYSLTGRQMSLTACPVPASHTHYPYNLKPVCHWTLIQWVCISVVWLLEFIENRHSSFWKTMSELENYWFWPKLESKNHRPWVSADTLKKNQQFSWIGCFKGEIFSKFWEAWLYMRNDPLMITTRGFFLYLTTA